jgi:hypothetical protein
MEPDRGHANKCALVVMCLKKYFPLDVIGLIASICWDLKSMPVLAFLTNEDAYTYVVLDYWEIMTQNISKLHPQLKLRHMNCQSIYQRKKGKTFLSCVYMSLLIPGFVWDKMIINHPIIDANEIFCDLTEIVSVEYPSKSFYHATVHSYPTLSTVSNIAWIHPLPMWNKFCNDCSSQINSFMDIQNKVAF